MLYYHNILSGIWAIDPSVADNYIPIISSILQGNVLSMSSTEPINPVSYSSQEKGGEAGVSEAEKIAIISIEGAITKYNQECGPMGMKAVASILNQLEKDSSIKGVVIKLDTPGGECSGAMVVVDALKAFTKNKVAYIEDLTASAGYWIASACDCIVAYSDRARIGSIGTFCTLVDYRKKFEKDGISMIEVYASKSSKKNHAVREALSGNSAPIQKEIDEVNEIFLNDIINHRGDRLSGDASVWNNGDMFYADKALEIGLIDAVDSFDNILDYF